MIGIITLLILIIVNSRIQIACRRSVIIFSIRRLTTSISRASIQQGAIRVMRLEIVTNSDVMIFRRKNKRRPNAARRRDVRERNRRGHRIFQVKRFLQGEAEVAEFVLGLRVVLVELDASNGAAVVRHEAGFERVQRRVGRQANDVVEQRDVEAPR